jgi:hypothetical protein
LYVSLTRVRTGDQPLGNATIVAEEMERWLRGIEGFRGMVMLSREGSTIGLTFWESREIADLHRPARMEFLQRMIAVVDVELEEILDYEVTFALLGALQVTPPT